MGAGGDTLRVCNNVKIIHGVVGREGKSCLTGMSKDAFDISNNNEEKSLEVESLVAIMDQIPVFIAIQEKYYTIRFANRNFRRLFGEHKGRLCYELYQGFTEPCKKCPTALVFDTEIPCKREWKNSDGLTYLIYDTPIAGDHGSTDVLTIGINITDLKKKQDVIIRDRNIESITIFARGIAHDFNNLLTSILGNISLAKMSLSCHPKTLTLLEKAETSSLHARDLTSKLITFAVGSDPIKKVTHIPNLIKKSAEVIFTNLDVKCKFYFSGDLWPVKIDEDQIAQVISHQFVNACEALRGEGLVQIRAENAVVTSGNALPLTAGNYVKISVKDQGIGIPEANIPKLFDPYFTTKEMGYRRGVGLGLAINYSIVKKHGGYITVESRKEIGTTFSIYLPASGNNP